MTEVTEIETEGKLEYKLHVYPLVFILEVEMQCQKPIQMVCISNNFILILFIKR